MVGAWNSQYERIKKCWTVQLSWRDAKCAVWSSFVHVQFYRPICDSRYRLFRISGGSASIIPSDQGWSLRHPHHMRGVNVDWESSAQHSYLQHIWQATTGDARPSMHLLMDTAVVSAVE